MKLSDDELMEELARRFAQSRKAFADLSVVNHKLLDMNERLERSESLKSNFLSNIRNEINNPLNAIMGLAGELAVVSGGNEEVSAIAALIGAEANQLDFQLRNIFMAAELEAGELNPHCVKAHVVEMLRELISSFQHAAAKKNLQLELLLSDDSEGTIVAVDYTKLQIIVSNLLANAIEFSNVNGRVEVSCSLSGDGVLTITITDHGIGIAHEDQQRVFDRFVQLDSGTTRSHLGHGLGLSITKALVELLQGAISLTSTPGEGTCVKVSIPPCSLLDDEDSFSEAGNLFLFDDMEET